MRALRIHWEKPDTAYRYKVESSADGERWVTAVDQSQNKTAGRITPHEVDLKEARFLRVTFLGTNRGYWGSLWEFEAYADKLPELPQLAAAPADAPASAPAATVADVRAPDGFDVKLFGSPPTVNYPVCLAAAPTGEVFVGVDEQGSLGKQKAGTMAGAFLPCRALSVALQSFRQTIQLQSPSARRVLSCRS